jgi:hypothetical protein
MRWVGLSDMNGSESLPCLLERVEALPLTWGVGIWKVGDVY